MNCLLKAAAVLAALVALSPSAAAAPPALLNTVEFRAESLAAIPQWQRALQGIEQERPAYHACRRGGESCPARSVRAWQAMIERQVDRPAIDQLVAVNLFLNTWRYKPDAHNYGQRDYWATPIEFLTRSGDCEDYAITKYVSLRQLGFAVEQLRLVVVQDTQRGIAHAVLAVYLQGEVWILDNLNRAVVRQDEVTHYVPYYSINENSRWAHVAPDTAVAARPATRIVPSTSEDGSSRAAGAPSS